MKQNSKTWKALWLTVEVWSADQQLQYFFTMFSAGLMVIWLIKWHQKHFDIHARSLLQVSGSTSFPRSVGEGVHFFSLSTGAMSGLRKHVTMRLVLLICTLTGHCSVSAPSAAPAPAAAGRGAQQDLMRMVEIVKHVEESRGRHSAKTEAPLTSRSRSSPVEPKDLHNMKTDRGDQTVGEWWLVVGAGPICSLSRGWCSL